MDLKKDEMTDKWKLYYYISVNLSMLVFSLDLKKYEKITNENFAGTFHLNLSMLVFSLTK